MERAENRGDFEAGIGWTGNAGSMAGRPPAECERRRRATDKLVGYFTKHTGRLNYRERLASGRAIGSGVAEGQAKTLGIAPENPRRPVAGCPADGESGLRVI